MSRLVEVRPGIYRDSVTLMQASQAVAAERGVSTAVIAMATEPNLDLLAGLGLEPPTGTGATDLVVALVADDDDALQRALVRVGDALHGSPATPAANTRTAGTPPPPRTTGSAAARTAEANLALVSTPGPYAVCEAMDALEAGLHVMVFSDNVPVADEVALKEQAERRNLLVMGPDCGTAVVGGVGLGFANVVRPGPVGIVSASGTGAQQLMCLLDASGVGISHCLGVGGRDLSAEVGGRSTLRALRMLADDDDTEVVVVLSKPPAAEVAQRITEAAATLKRPVVLGLLGPRRPDLTEVAAQAVRAAGSVPADIRWWLAPVERRSAYPAVRGLFAGGTLCDEAMLIVSAALGPVRSNIPLDRAWTLPADLRARGHVMIDFGDDRLTRGRPHPMIDNTLRVRRLVEEAADPGCGVLLLDVVLGHGAHPDPAADLAPAIVAAHDRAAADGRQVAVVVSLCGTAGDPQGLTRQAEALRDAGASVHLSNAHAARKAVELVESA